MVLNIAQSHVRAFRQLPHRKPFAANLCQKDQRAVQDMPLLGTQTIKILLFIQITGSMGWTMVSSRGLYNIVLTVLVK